MSLFRSAEFKIPTPDDSREGNASQESSLVDSRTLKRIEILTKRIVSHGVAGQYHSVFRGQGMEFNEVREYQPGDDVRAIDWNVTARTGVAHIKRYVEERELTVAFCVDRSASADFGTMQRLKRTLAAQACAVLAFSAISNNDRVGLMLFSDEVERFVPPRKGRNHVLRVVRELMQPATGRGTNIPGALEQLNHLMRRRAVVFLVSDFEQPPEVLRPSLAIAAQRHDLVAITIQDPREIALPDVGVIEIADPETGERRWIDTSSPRVRTAYAASRTAHAEDRTRLFRSLGIDHIVLNTDSDFVPPLLEFFQRRSHRM